MDVKLPVASYQVVVRGLATVLDEVDGAAFGPDRTLMLPSVSLSCAELHAAALQLAGAHGLARVGAARAEAQEVATRIVSSMGERSDGSRAVALGIPRDEGAESIVRMYAEEWVVRPEARGVDA